MEDRDKDKNQATINTEATALVEMIESERFEEVFKQLEGLKTRQFTDLKNIVLIFALGYFFTYFLPQSEAIPSFYYVVMYVVIVSGIYFSESRRANKRIDLIVKLLKMKRPTI